MRGAYITACRYRLKVVGVNTIYPRFYHSPRQLLPMEFDCQWWAKKLSYREQDSLFNDAGYPCSQDR
jgi:hypothetical protein